MTLVPGALNFRDVGGLPAGSGATRPRVLFRSGNLARLTGEGCRALADLGVRRIVDLRADDEVATQHHELTGQDTGASDGGEIAGAGQMGEHVTEEP